MTEGNSTRSYVLYLAYTCSFCNASVINDIRVNVRADYDTGLIGGKMVDDIDKACNDGIVRIINDIDKLKTQHFTPYSFSDEIAYTSNGYHCCIRIANPECKCAFCGSIAPWSREKNPFYLPRLKDNQYPVLIDKNEVSEWGNEQINMQKHVADERDGADEVLSTFTRTENELKRQLRSLKEEEKKCNLNCSQIKNEYERSNFLRKKNLKKILNESEVSLSQLNNAIQLIESDIASMQNLRHWKTVLELGYEKQEISRVNSYFDKYDNKIGSSIAIILNYVGSNIEIGDKEDNFYTFEHGYSLKQRQMEDNVAEKKIYDENTDEKTNDCNSGVNEPKVLFCHKCGYKLHEGSCYCSKCGTKM